MKTKKTSLLAAISVFAVFILFQSCSPRLHTNLAWQPEPASVDAPESWLLDYKQDEKTSLRYTLSNDRDNLYILIMASDEATKIRMLRGGMQLVIDTIGERRDPCSIGFPLKLEPGFAGGVPGRTPQGIPGREPDRYSDRGQERDHSRRPGGAPGRVDRRSSEGRDQGPDRTAMYQQLIGLQTRAIIRGFKDHPHGRISPVTKGGIYLSLDIDTTGVLSYRAVIPLKTFYKAGIAAADTLKKFGLTVKIHGLDTPTRAAGGVMVDRRMPTGGQGPYGPGGTRGIPGTAGPGYGGRGVHAITPVTADFRDLGKTLSFKTRFNLTLP